MTIFQHIPRKFCRSSPGHCYWCWPSFRWCSTGIGSTNRSWIVCCGRSTTKTSRSTTRKTAAHRRRYPEWASTGTSPPTTIVLLCGKRISKSDETFFVLYLSPRKRTDRFSIPPGRKNRIGVKSASAKRNVLCSIGVYSFGPYSISVVGM